MEKSRILVVDDEPDVIKIISVRLKAAGYDVITAEDGQEGLLKARTEKPDLVLLDLMLPKVDGFQVCRMLKYDENFKSIPIILLTARTQEADKQAGKDVGADAYIEKPFDYKELLTKIEELLKK